MRAFFAMGGYGLYVWTAFGFTAVAMLGLLIQSLYLARKRVAELETMRRQMHNAQASAPLRLRPVRLSSATAAGEGSATAASEVKE